MEFDEDYNDTIDDFVIVMRMIEVGIPARMASLILAFSRLYEGVHDLRMMWAEELNPNDQAMVALDLITLIEELAEKWGIPSK